MLNSNTISVAQKVFTSNRELKKYVDAWELLFGTTPQIQVKGCFEYENGSFDYEALDWVEVDKVTSTSFTIQTPNLQSPDTRYKCNGYDHYFVRFRP